MISRMQLLAIVNERVRVLRIVHRRAMFAAWCTVSCAATARLFFLPSILAVLATPVSALGIDDVVGSWTLVSSTSRIVATGVVTDTFGANPKGWINYGRDGRMIVLIVGGDRPKIRDPEKLTDSDRAQLFKTMTAYSGTYSFAGGSVIHRIDTSWNEVWTGMSVVRTVTRQGNRLVYTTEVERGFGDGSPSVTTLVWERGK